MPRINIPPLTRACLVACTCLSVLTAALKYRAWMSQQQKDDESASPGSQMYTVPYLTVVPSQSIIFPWTFVTATLVEQNIFTLVITLATVFYGGKYLERAWGSAEFAKFLLVVSLIPNVVAFAVYIIWFALSGNIMRSLVHCSLGGFV
jgi:membrane associated rhomboid family serine protease